jgi:AcrR family transcriptional regulator
MSSGVATAAIPPAIPPRYGNQRRRSSQSRTAILDAVRELLTLRRLEDLQVNEIVERAEISRPTFYSHFETKYSVVAALVADMGQSIHDHWQPVFSGRGPIREDQLREVGRLTLQAWREQGALFGATIEGWHSDQEIHDAWNDVLERFRVALTERLARWRPLTARDEMAVPAMISFFERCVYLAVSVPDTPLGKSDDQLAELLASVWVKTLRG